MKTKAFTYALVALLTLLASPASHAVLEPLEQSYEGPLLITMFSATRGQAVVSRCETCEEIILRIDENTKFYINQEEAPLSAASRYKGWSGVVFQEEGTDRVSRFRVFATNQRAPQGGEK